jgi:hypothetical protein
VAQGSQKLGLPPQLILKLGTGTTRSGAVHSSTHATVTTLQLPIDLHDGHVFRSPSFAYFSFK